MLMALIVRLTALIVLLMLLGWLTGCMHQSDAMLELLQSPTYGRLLNWYNFRPLTVEHLEPHP
jgi:hypothetical protein